MKFFYLYKLHVYLLFGTKNATCQYANTETYCFNFKVTERLLKLGGQHFKDAIKRSLQKVLSDEVMTTYSLVGHKRKKVFKQTFLYKSILGKRM